MTVRRLALFLLVGAGVDYWARPGGPAEPGELTDRTESSSVLARRLTNRPAAALQSR